MENEAGFEVLSYFLLVHVYIGLQVLLIRNLPINPLGLRIVEICLFAYPCFFILVACFDILSVSEDPAAIMGSICATLAIVKISIPLRLATLLIDRNFEENMRGTINMNILYLLGITLIMVSGQETCTHVVIVVLSFSLIWFLSYVEGAGLGCPQVIIGTSLAYCFWDSGFTLDLGTVIFTESLLVFGRMPLLGICILTQCGMTLFYDHITAVDPFTRNLPLWSLNQQIKMELDALARPNNTFVGE